MKNVDSSYYQSEDGQNVKRILVDAYLHLIEGLLDQRPYRHVIQMGYGDGAVVEFVLKRVAEVTIVEGDQRLADRARRHHDGQPTVHIIHDFFETFRLKKPLADLILGNHVLEHVDDPVGVLEQTRTWLKKGGTALFTVPNATSLHRRIGVRMGLLKTVYDLNEQDHRVGHQRVYDAKTFQADLKKSGYMIKTFGGFNLKLVSQNQMKDWPDELLKAIYEVSLECQADFCSNLYAICRK